MMKDKVCEYCGKKHDGKYGSGRFCCASCARGFATKENRQIINKHISETMKGKRATENAYTENARSKQRQSLLNTLHQKHTEHAYRSFNGNKLNITSADIENYRKTHVVCEICGKAETAIAPNKKQQTPNNLCVDHNHKTNKFRGLLCRNCNSRLGWYENNKDIIHAYLRRGCK